MDPEISPGLRARLAAVEDPLAAAVRRFEAEGSDADRAWFEAMSRAAHEHAAALRSPRHPELTWVRSVLGRAEQHLAHALTDEAVVEADGALVGVGKYEQLDPHWSLALIQYLEHRHHSVPFGQRPAHVELDRRATLAVAGDWGTGFWRGRDTPAAKVAAQMQALAPDWTIHLGDVYYAGTPDEQRDNLERVWPRGRQGQLLLNSNHEMYSGGWPLFEGTLPRLAPQQGQTSYWTAANEHWFILGLDTAYFASDMYLVGDLGPNGGDSSQLRWLSALRQQIGGRKLIVMSHHQAVDLPGARTTAVFDQLRQALQRVPDYWYWGHFHNAVVYHPRGGVAGRCIGHGAIPYGDARELAEAPAVAWFERERAGDPECEARVACGFLALDLDGPELHERLIGEDGSLRWSASAGG